MTTARNITRDPAMSTSVHIIDNYSPRRGDTGVRGHVLRVDSSLAGGVARFPHAAEIVLTPERAKEIRAALDDYISGEERSARIAKREERAAERRQRADDENTARALAVGTRVQISDAPVQTRGGMRARSADLFAGKAGVVRDHVETPNNPHNGVRAGRVVVDVPGVVTPQGLSTTDIHVSSLTVLPPEPTFKTGDRVTVAAKPGTYADGTGFVSKEFRGADVTVVAPDDDAHMFPEECVLVRIGADPTNTNYVHPAFLTKAPGFKVGDVVKVLPTYAAEYWAHGHPAHNKHGVVNEIRPSGHPYVQVGTATYGVAPEHLEMVVPA